ncbi:MAG: RNA polymerase sigma factor [Planctomycetota bacterium]|nr:RNA polymerase sigma factor [Planctomycetota bacterium]
MEESDPELVRRAADGERLAFQTLVQRHAKYLFSLAYSLVGCGADAEDVVQESLTGAYRGLRKYEGRAPVKLWLAGIVARQAARLHYKRGLRPTISLDQASNEQDSLEPAMRIGTGTIEVDRRLDIESFLQKLSDSHRQVIVLRELNGLSYEEIADVLRVPRGTVESRLFRARAELSQLLKSYHSGS